jgi:hypothetical protein
MTASTPTDASVVTMPADPAPLDLDTAPDPLEGFVLLPGLLRPWEISQVVKPDSEFRIEEAGTLADQTPVFAVYRRDPTPAADAELSVPVALSFENGRTTVPARFLPISGEPLMAVVVLGDSPEDTSALARVRDHLVRAAHRAGEKASGAQDANARRQEGAV